MRAAVLNGVNEPLVIEELRDPTPNPGEVLLDVSNCGVCHTDLHVMKGEVIFPMPAVLGHEISGVVADVGEGVTNVRKGDRVVASFIMPCGYCVRCVRGEEDLCETFFSFNRLKGVLYDGTTRLAREDGSPVWMYSMAGLAEQSVVPCTDVFVVPDSLALGEIATLGCSALTAYGALRNVADLHTGDSVAVVAAGGVGSSIIQLAIAFGASTVIAVDISDEKLEAARVLGATHTVNALTSDATEVVRELTQGRGVDVVFEALGSSSTFAIATSLATDGGRVVIVGIAPAGVTGPTDLARLARRKLRILGSYGGRPRTDMPAIIALAHRGAFQPSTIVSRHFSLDEADRAYGALNKGEITGRAVVDIASAQS